MGRKMWTDERKPFVSFGQALVGGFYGNPIYAAGWDRASAIFESFAKTSGLTYHTEKLTRLSITPGTREWMPDS